MKLLIMVFRERKHKVPTLQRQNAAFSVCQESAPRPAGLLCRDGGFCPTAGTCCHFRCLKPTQPSPWLADATQGIGKGSCPSAAAAGCPEASWMAAAAAVGGLISRTRRHGLALTRIINTQSPEASQ